MTPECCGSKCATTGVGFDPATTAQGDGFVNMRDRLGAFGGALEVTSAPDCGTAVRGTVPIGVGATSTRRVGRWCRRRLRSTRSSSDPARTGSLRRSRWHRPGGRWSCSRRARGPAAAPARWSSPCRESFTTCAPRSIRSGSLHRRSVRSRWPTTAWSGCTRTSRSPIRSTVGAPRCSTGRWRRPPTASAPTAPRTAS